ncbi:hypothetical protein ABZS29_01105 [Kribbella sp. NPDC005582]|uniref:hypothetical protein n=1 Tax=Kribbella sp. NPDC005582 TaxID=3156893 RepID=UPI0033A59F5E
MIDEQLLLERLTDAAAAQDDLLPRAVADDLAAGRRRLRRRRFLAAGTAVVAAGAVAVAMIGVNGVLKDPAQLQVPIATQQAPAPSKPVDFDKLMKGLMFKHFDPQKKHLNFTTGPFDIDTTIGRHGTQRKVGWNTKGDKGQGMFLIELSRSAKAADSTCGSFSQFESKPVKCQSVTLPNGRPAMLGRQGRMIEFSYLQPDGEFVYVGVDPVFRNNTTIASADMAVTNEQLFAFATDPALNLPPLSAAQQADEAKLKDFAPTPAQAEAVVLAKIGGRLTREYLEDRPGELYVSDKWSKGAVTATVEISADASILASECKAQLSVPSCTEVHHSGKVVEYHEGARTYQGGPKFVMGATYKQPDGDLAAVRVLYDGKKAPAGAIPRGLIMDLVTDPAFDR